MVLNFFLVGLGGAVGAMLRYGVTLLFAAMEYSSNLATFLVNVTGSFLMGFLAGNFEHSPMLLLATVGICGGFTTFSTFSMQSVTLIQQGRFGMAAVYIVSTAVCCVLFAALGYYLRKI